MRRILKLAMIVGGLVVASKLVSTKKAEWQGLTEVQAREKIQARLPSEMPPDKRDIVIDKAVAALRDRGMLSDVGEATSTAEPVAPVTDSAPDSV